MLLLWCISGGVLQRGCKGQAQEAHFLGELKVTTSGLIEQKLQIQGHTVGENLGFGFVKAPNQISGTTKISTLLFDKVMLEKKEISTAPLRMIHPQACPMSKNELKELN